MPCVEKCRRARLRRAVAPSRVSPSRIAPLHRTKSGASKMHATGFFERAVASRCVIHRQAVHLYSPYEATVREIGAAQSDPFIVTWLGGYECALRRLISATKFAA